MSKRLPDVGPLELEILGVLNANQEQSVAEIQTLLKKAGNDLAYTTVMTVLVRLHNKELVSRRKEGRLFLYSATSRKGATPLKIFEKLKNSLFGSEKLRPILGLLDSDDSLSKEELQELKKAIDEKLKRM